MDIPKVTCKILKGRSKFDYLFEYQDGKCFYCQKEMTNDATMDHVVPKSKGGKKSRKNIVLACRNCNSKKGNMPIEKFLLTLKIK